ncbi:MAG: DUF5691 domain-containing protein [Chloroflexota bacterium]
MRLADLVKPTLLGTEHTHLSDLEAPLTGQDEVIDQVLSQIADDSQKPEAQLLNLAGTLSLHQRVGQHLPRIRKMAPAPEAVPEDWPVCNAQVLHRLTLLLNGRYEALLGEFLAALRAAQLRVPPLYVPNILDRGTRLSLLRPDIMVVCGETGTRLAKNNPSWSYANGGDDSWTSLIELWEGENSLGRQGLLRYLRNTQPARGRQLLEHGWKSEKTSSRQGLLRILQTNLSMDDEPFLERALDDRDNTVRRRAAELLTYLPPSRLCRRMTKHAGTVLVWDRAQAGVLKVVFPETVTAAMVRDGVLPRKGTDPSRVQRPQLVEIISAIPLDHWTTAWQASPETIIHAFSTSRWPKTLLRAFAQAADRQRHIGWARALLKAEPCHINVLRLVPVLPEADFVALVRQHAQSNAPLDKDHCLVKVLRRWTKAWPQAVADVWFTKLADHIKQNPNESKRDSLVQITIRQSAHSCPHSCASFVA